MTSLAPTISHLNSNNKAKDALVEFAIVSDSPFGVETNTIEIGRDLSRIHDVNTCIRSRANWVFWIGNILLQASQRCFSHSLMPFDLGWAFVRFYGRCSSITLGWGSGVLTLFVTLATGLYYQDEKYPMPVHFYRLKHLSILRNFCIYNSNNVKLKITPIFFVG